ncbi:uncharacterized protein Z519_01818 [Cladophialophora bantiana CBS 173.52]|uniref:FAD/NAD(P)-binding domain-containing protein n=1 Tax=Cladophialophora bantiana (strain ATCC 10958 / CBS 173.52 / CDC B-1940 / NIH 8579) TaxID=1442370 RepID=A0A0D2IN63_CLAB1|nr:uncharacterized protein Z519_01818 [Cladophialophora bantiana CBS 173.52]KIW98234.1 hypothetical protein Z519_01818 [Cladophialophora bantiana CBS 173.52]
MALIGVPAAVDDDVVVKELITTPPTGPGALDSFPTTFIRELKTNGTASGDEPTDGATPATSTNGLLGSHSETTKKTSRERHVVPLMNIPGYSVQRKLRVITIGAGFSGLMFAHKIRYEHPEMQNIVTNTIFEARSEVGGTWLVNTYPGVQCDVPSHIYAFPFDPNPNWDRFYSSGAEIHEYMVKTVKKWNLDRDVQLNTKVTGVFWQQDLGQWKVTVECNSVQRDEYAEILISAQGFLNAWDWPDIYGLSKFKGHKVHSANWDHSYDYSKKRIAIIGNGSSGIQILPKLAQLEGTDVLSIQRGPSWIVARMDPGKLLGKSGLGSNPEYTEEDKKLFRENPEALHQYRKKLIHSVNKAFKMFVKGSPENIDNQEFAARQMAEKLNNDPGLCAKLIPTWELGCRRVTPGSGYLESFLLPNVHLKQTSIKEITEDSIVTADGEVYPVDVVVCATGFDVSHCPHYPVIGRDGVSLAAKWADEPESYLSVACPDFPNYFIFTGPNAVVGHGSLIEGLSWTADYMIKWLKKIANEDIRSVEPKQSAVDDFVTYGDEIHKTLTWTGQCRSWYKKNRVDGRVTATFPGSALLYKRMISDIRGEDWNIEYNSPNRFRFMGNGFTEYELDETNDLAWYVSK